MQAVIYGAGSIGRGFIGQLFNDSRYDVVFIDTDQSLIDLLNERRWYPLRFVADNKSREIIVDNIRGLYAQATDKVAEQIAQAGIMATAVGKNVLPAIAPIIALGLQKRWASGNKRPLNILVCENMIKANEYLASLICGYLDEHEKERFSESVGMVETSIERNVPVMTAALTDGDPLRVIAEDYSELPVDRSTFKGEIPSIRHMKAYAPFDFYIQRKLFMYNMGHALIAYLAFVQGIDKLAEAVRMAEIKYMAKCAMQEAAIALGREHSENLENLLEFSSELLCRFGNRPLGITVERLGRDPERKLSNSDRLVGSAELCVKNGINPGYIPVGIAAGYCYAQKEDRKALEIQDYVAKNGIEKALYRYSGMGISHPLSKYIIDLFEMLKNRRPLCDIIEKAEIFTCWG